MKPTDRHPLADTLLDAHVAFLIDELCGRGLRAWITRSVDDAFAAVDALPLRRLVDREAVQHSIARFALDNALAEAVGELVTDAALRLRDNPVHESTTLGDCLPEASLSAILDRLLVQRDLRAQLVHALLTSEAYTGFVSELLYHGLQGWLSDNPLAQAVPGARTAVKFGRSMLGRAGLDRAVDERMRHYIDRSVHATAHVGERFLVDIEDAALRDAALGLWRQLRDEPLARFTAQLDDAELEAWTDVGYRQWLHLRQGAWLREMIDSVVDVIFERYGDHAPGIILADLGIDAARIAAELSRHARPLLRALKKDGRLQGWLRGQLAPFYHSPQFMAAIAGYAPD